MTLLERIDRILSFATLRETRAHLRSGRALLLVGGLSSVYAIVSMFVGQMILLGAVDGGPSYYSVVQAGNSLQWWNYPALLVVEPWGILTFPFLTTIVMILTSIGVGVGATIGVLLIGPLLLGRRRSGRRTAATGAVAGIGPAITGVATLGACCCTSCAGLVGVSVIAAASGASAYGLLLNNWYIGIFELGVIYLSLIAQERALRITSEECPVPPPLDRRFAAGAILRLALLISGITWSIAMLAEWATISPLTAPAPLWYHWIFEHQLLAVTAMAAGLFPKEFANGLQRFAKSLGGRIGRIVLAVTAITWGTWVPPVLVSVGLGGFVNELFGYLGLPASLGAEPPDLPIGAALYFHWAFQHLLLSGFALTIAVAPFAVAAPLLWTVTAARPLRAPAEQSGGIPPEGPVPRPVLSAGRNSPESRA